MPGEAAPPRLVYEGPGGRAARAVGELEPGMLDLWWLYPPGASERDIHHLTLQSNPAVPGVYLLMVSTTDAGTARRAHYQARANAGPGYRGQEIPDATVAAVQATTTVHVETPFPAPGDDGARELVRRMLKVAVWDGAPPIVPTTEDDRHTWRETAKIAGLLWCVERARG